MEVIITDNSILQQLDDINVKLIDLRNKFQYPTYSENIILLYERIFNIYYKISLEPSKEELLSFLSKYTVIKYQYYKTFFFDIIGISKLFKLKGIQKLPKLCWIYSFSKFKLKVQDTLYTKYHEEKLLNCWMEIVNTAHKDKIQITNSLVTNKVTKFTTFNNGLTGSVNYIEYDEDEFISITNQYSNKNIDSLHLEMKNRFDNLKNWLEQSKELFYLYKFYKSIQKQKVFKRILWLNICEYTYYVFLNASFPLDKNCYFDFLEKYIGIDNQKLKQIIRNTISIINILKKSNLKKIEAGKWIVPFSKLKLSYLNEKNEDEYFILSSYYEEGVIECWKKIIKDNEETKQPITNSRINKVITDYIKENEIIINNTIKRKKRNQEELETIENPIKKIKNDLNSIDLTQKENVYEIINLEDDDNNNDIENYNEETLNCNGEYNFDIFKDFDIDFNEQDLNEYVSTMDNYVY